MYASCAIKTLDDDAARRARERLPVDDDNRWRIGWCAVQVTQWGEMCAYHELLAIDAARRYRRVGRAHRSRFTTLLGMQATWMVARWLSIYTDEVLRLSRAD